MGGDFHSLLSMPRRVGKGKAPRESIHSVSFAEIVWVRVLPPLAVRVLYGEGIFTRLCEMRFHVWRGHDQNFCCSAMGAGNSVWIFRITQTRRISADRDRLHKGCPGCRKVGKVPWKARKSSILGCEEKSGRVKKGNRRKREKIVYYWFRRGTTTHSLGSVDFRGRRRGVCTKKFKVKEIFPSLVGEISCVWRSPGKRKEFLACPAINHATKCSHLREK